MSKVVDKMNVYLVCYSMIFVAISSSGLLGGVDGFSTPSPPTTMKKNDIGNWLSNILSPKSVDNNVGQDTVKGFKGSNGKDEEYPYYFRGRLWFRPAFVRTSSPSPFPPVVKMVSLFGWTVGGVVALEYDESPVGPYREYVTMGSVVSSSKSLLGQWGSRLYVSTPEAERICQQIWNVPAEYASIQFLEDTNSDVETSLNVSQPPPSSFTTNSNNPPTICVNNWSQTRVLTEPPQKENDDKRWTLPVLWTPSIKALWAPFLSLPSTEDVDDDGLTFNQLRLSAGALRLCWCSQESSPSLGIPIGIGLVVDDVLIEISPPKGTFY